MTEFGNKLQEAIESKNNDINTFVWKYLKHLWVVGKTVM